MQTLAVSLRAAARTWPSPGTADGTSPCRSPRSAAGRPAAGAAVRDPGGGRGRPAGHPRRPGGHIDRYLVPSLGRITLADLTGRRLQACFDLLARQRTRNGTLIAATTVDRIRATLRSALNAAVREGLIASNPLAQVRLARPVRPHPVIWTDERVEAWRRDGIRPPVAVWTLRQLVTFLGVENDRLAAL